MGDKIRTMYNPHIEKNMYSIELMRINSRELSDSLIKESSSLLLERFKEYIYKSK